MRNPAVFLNASSTSELRGEMVALILHLPSPSCVYLRAPGCDVVGILSRTWGKLNSTVLLDPSWRWAGAVFGLDWLWSALLDPEILPRLCSCGWLLMLALLGVTENLLVGYANSAPFRRVIRSWHDSAYRPFSARLSTRHTGLLCIRFAQNVLV